MSEEAEASWLAKDFHVLYRTSRHLIDKLDVACDDDPDLQAVDALRAQLVRLEPAFRLVDGSEARSRAMSDGERMERVLREDYQRAAETAVQLRAELEEVSGQSEFWYQALRSLVALIVHRQGTEVADRLVGRVEAYARDGFPGEARFIELCDTVAGQLLWGLSRAEELRGKEPSDE